MRALYSVSEILLYNTLTIIFKSTRTKIHPLEGFPKVVHRKIMSILVKYKMEMI